MTWDIGLETGEQQSHVEFVVNQVRGHDRVEASMWIRVGM